MSGLADQTRWLDATEQAALVTNGEGTHRTDAPGRAVRGVHTAVQHERTARHQPPAARNAQGLPIGVQLAAGYGREEVLIRVAAQLETAHRWSSEHPPIP